MAKYSTFADLSSGGHFSTRLTAPLVYGAAICKSFLADEGVRFYSHIYSIKDLLDTPFNGENLINHSGNFVNSDIEKQALQLIERTREEQNAVGGAVECVIENVGEGLGRPVFTMWSVHVRWHLQICIWRDKSGRIYKRD